MHGTITSRVSIRWGDDEPQESTSTLVLTSPNNLFVDLRIFNNVADPSQAIDWAFAGRAHKIPGGGSWEHWVDSRTDTPGPDSGSFETLPNGDVLERGSMPDDNGVVRPYEEIWRDLQVDPAVTIVLVCYGRSSALNLGADSIQSQTKSNMNFHGIVGMVVRVGGWCQGLLKVQNELTAGRWQMKGKTWEQLFSFGQGPGHLPFSEACVSTDTVNEGDALMKDGFLWKCAEKM